MVTAERLRLRLGSGPTWVTGGAGSWALHGSVSCITQGNEVWEEMRTDLCSDLR